MAHLTQQTESFIAYCFYCDGFNVFSPNAQKKFCQIEAKLWHFSNIIRIDSIFYILWWEKLFILNGMIAFFSYIRFGLIFYSLNENWKNCRRIEYEIESSLWFLLLAGQIGMNDRSKHWNRILYSEPMNVNAHRSKNGAWMSCQNFINRVLFTESIDQPDVMTHIVGHFTALTHLFIAYVRRTRDKAYLALQMND